MPTSGDLQSVSDGTEKDQRGVKRFNWSNFCHTSDLSASWNDSSGIGNFAHETPAPHASEAAKDSKKTYR
jgi:hypothetical protein